MSKVPRKQINLRCDDELRAAIGDLQRLDTSHLEVPSITEAIRRAIFAQRSHLLEAAERRKFFHK